MTEPKNEVSSPQVLSVATTITPLNLKESNMCVAWKMWKNQFKIFMRASNLEQQSNQRKVALLLHHLGPDCLQVFDSFDADMDTVKYEDLVAKLDAYFIPRANVAMERHKFFSRKQSADESIEQYVTSLKNLSSSCEFEQLREDLIKDIFICGLLPNYAHIKEKLLSEGKITLEKALNLAKSINIAKENASQLHQEVNFVSAIQKSQKSNYNNNYNYKKPFKPSPPSNASPPPTSSSSKKSSPSLNCSRCGQVHRNKCPAEKVNCHICRKTGHYARMCFFKSQQQQNMPKKYVKYVHQEEESETDLFVGTLTHSSIRETENTISNIHSNSQPSNSEWNIEVNINRAKIIFQIDTGAQANILSVKSANYLNLNNNVLPSNVNILSFSGEKLPIIGKVDLNISFENQFYTSDFYILNLNCKNIIGLDLAIKMNLIKKINVLNTDKIVEKYSNVFNGLGHIKTECNLRLKEDVVPVVDPPRKIPFSLHKSLKDELDRMVQLQVIIPVTEPTEWVNSMVIVTKPNKKLRICLDPRNLNKAILRPHYPFPNIEDCKSRLNGSKIFSSLDANSGFWMIPLADSSSKLCTFNTPYGRYRFLRLPFGINAAPEIFHSEIVKLFGDIEGLIIYIDDFLIFSNTIQEHNIILEKVLERAEKVGFKFNKEKCKFQLKEIKFIGHIFNENGVQPDREKVDAILDMPIPKNVSELQRFLGMINYLGPFIQNMSSKNKRLRELLQKNIQWHWDKIHNDEFENLKLEITKSPVLTYFDPNKTLILTVDASKFAVGAAILHDGQPIAYASASLTSAQENYAQIEKELFAILFGCTKFHQYTYGIKVLVETDHKPLVSLYDKPLHKIPARLQRFMLRLQSYDLKIVYKPGKYLYIADTLSRCPLKINALTDTHEEISLHCNFLKSHLEIPFSNVNEIVEESKSDEIFIMIKSYVKDGWPKHKKLVNKEVMPYFKIKDEIHIIDDILLKNNQVLIPTKLRKTILNSIHESHMGIQRCQTLARQSVYWPNMYNDIFIMISNCEICMKHRNSKTKQEMISHDVYDIPWFKLGCDIFEFNKKQYLLVVDYFSKFIEIELLNSGYASSQIILKFKSIFARHGIPQILISDNGPPFNSNELKMFCSNWGIDHKTSSPYMPRSNGLAERSIQTIKNILYKCQDSGSDPYMSLLLYRTTPKGNLPSPSELLFSRKLRTKLPNLSENFQPKLIDYENYKKQVNSKIQNSSENFNKHVKKHTNVNTGDRVMFKRNPTSFWFPGEIIGTCSEPRSFVVKDNDGVVYRRNEEHIFKTPERHNQTNEIVNNGNLPQELNQNVSNEYENQNTPYVTRRGRKIVTPARYK